MRNPHRRLLAGIATLATAGLVLVPTAGNAEPATPAAATSDAPLIGSSTAERFIVVMDEAGSKADLRAAKADARTDGAVVEHTYQSVVDGFVADLTPESLDALRANPDVAYIEADQPVTATATQSPVTWGLDRIDQRSLPLSGSYTYNQTGSGVTAYIIDTGIRAAHADFGGRVTSGYTAINDGRGTEDCNGHGTHVAGTVGGATYGVAKGVRLVPVRVLDCAGSGTTAGVIAGVDWVTSNHAAGAPAVANMSLGGGISTTLDNAVARSIADGVSYAVAAGNDSGANACNTSPSRVANALTVGSTTTTDARSSFSNIGSCLDLFAPGSGITSAWYTSNTATNTISGTSMATPHVAGAAALYLQTNPSATPATVSSYLIGRATTGVVGNAGTGSPNRLLFVG